MLTETFIASSSAAPKLTSTNSSLLKDAGIYLHTFQPSPSLRSTLKKSQTAPNCLAASASHIFAAQAEKSLVHVYNREKGSQEATVPFPEKIRSLALAAEGTVLVLGTEGGGVLLWEVGSGRQLATPQAHLRAVCVLAVDPKSNYLLSGSEDSSVLVWSLLDLLSFPPASALAQHEGISPRHTLAAHRGPITSLAVGHSATNSNIAVSTSSDNTAVVWDYRTGTQLRTFLLPATPLCVTLDPADRAIYIGYEDGDIQLVDFHDPTFTSNNIRDPAHASTPLQPPTSSRWKPPNPEAIGAALAVTLSYDGTTLLSGHAGGKILSWDVASGALRTAAADYPGTPITNLQFLAPTGFPGEEGPRFKMSAVVKPRPHESFSSARGQLSEIYTFTAHFPTRLRNRITTTPSEFDLALTAPILPTSLLASSTTSSLSTTTTPSAPAPAPAPLTPASDYLSLTLDGASSSPAPSDPTTLAELERLRSQVAHLKRVQVVCAAQMEKMGEEVGGLRKREGEWRERRRRKGERRRGRGERVGEGLGVKEKGAKGREMEVKEKGAKGREMEMEVDGRHSGTSSSSSEESSDDG